MGGLRMPRRLTAAAVIAGVVVAATLCAPAATAGPATSDPANLAQLAQLFGVDGTPADYVVAVDYSTSMADKPYQPWRYVRPALGALVAGVQPSDRVGIYGFGSTIDEAWPVSSRVPKARAKMLAGLPRQPYQTATDLGSAARHGIDQLARPGSSEVQTLVILTDGKHQPPSNSDFPRTTGPEWRKQAKRFAELSKNKRIKVLAVRLTPDADVTSLQQVFPNLQVVSFPLPELTTALRQIPLDGIREKLRPLVVEELQRSISAELSITGSLAQDTPGVVRLTNGSQKLRTAVSVTAVKAVDGSGAEVPFDLPAGSRTATLEPGGVLEIPIVLHPSGTDRGIQVGRQVDERTITVTVDGTRGPVVAPLLVREGLASKDVAATLFTASASTKVAIAFGIAIATIVIVVLLLCGILLLARWLYRRLFRLPDLEGTFESFDGQAMTQVARLEGHEMVVPTASAAWGPTDGDRVRLFTVKRRHGVVFAEPVDGHPRVDNGDLIGAQDLPAVGVALRPGDALVLGTSILTYRRN